MINREGKTTLYSEPFTHTQIYSHARIAIHTGNLDLVKEKTARRGQAPDMLEQFADLDQRRLTFLAEVEG